MDQVAVDGAEVAAALRRSMTALAGAGRQASSLGGEARRSLLAEVDRASGVLATVRAELALAEREFGAWRGSGEPSFAAWRGRTTREGVRGGASEERRGEVLASVPRLRDAAVAGQVSVAHVDVVGRTAGSGSPAVRDALQSPEGQRRVLEMAQRLDAGRFTTAMAQWAATIDAGALERGHQGQRAARFLHLTDAADGTRISGRLDRMAGHRLRLALEALSPRPAVGDDRSSEQRRADALESMAEKILALPETVPGAAQRPHVSFLMTEETWAALRAAKLREGLGSAAAAEAAPVAPVTLEDGTPVPWTEVARALCDCELTRIVLDSNSEPLDLGRTERTYTGAQRRAVIARDGGCFWEGCSMAPRWLEVHHVRWWDRDTGPTSVTNGVAACSFHHHEVHRRDLTITRVPLDRTDVGMSPRRVRYVVSTPDGRIVAGQRPDGAWTPDAVRRPEPGWPPDAACPPDVAQLSGSKPPLHPTRPPDSSRPRDPGADRASAHGSVEQIALPLGV